MLLLNGVVISLDVRLLFSGEWEKPAQLAAKSCQYLNSGCNLKSICLKLTSLTQKNTKSKQNQKPSCSHRADT